MRVTKVKIIMIGGGNRGYSAYGEAILLHEDASVVALAEPQRERRERFALRHNIENSLALADWRELLERPKFADGVIVATPDNLHVEPTIMALKRGYSVLLEKPIATDLKSLALLAAMKNEVHRLFLAHVLRYASFFKKLKELLDHSIIGQTVAIDYTERISYYHFAHSYVRGNWRNTDLAGPSILSKSCHDMDIIGWFVPSKVLSLSSRGGLHHFKRDAAPAGSTRRCLSCPLKNTCPYSAVTLYLGENTEWPVNTISTDMSYEGRLRALEGGPYGRCVYRSDNNVADYQNAVISFENGTDVLFTMNAFTHDKTRRLRIHGSHGEIHGDFERDLIEVDVFGRKSETYKPARNPSRHGGGDQELVDDFVRYLKGELQTLPTTFEASLQSHLMCWAAEKSRLLSGEAVAPWGLI